MKDMQNSQVLDKTADILEHDGWTRGVRGMNPDGGPKCIDGALNAALGWRLGDAFMVEWHPAGLALKEFLGLNNQSLCGWNDHHAENTVEVIGVLRDCAEKERLHGR